MLNKIIIITTAWGAKYGGINVFNYGICSALPKVLPEDYKLECIIYPSKSADIPNNKETQEALKLGLTLKYVDANSEFFDVYWKAVGDTKANGDVVKWWVGHDVHTGHIAKKCKEIHGNMGGASQLALIKHMHYSSYATHKLYKNQADGKLVEISAEEIGNKIEEQNKLFPQADIIFGVGPKLAEYASDNHDNPEAIVEIIPGLEAIEHRDPSKPFSVFMSGRLDETTTPLKQQRIVAAAFGLAHKESVEKFNGVMTEEPHIFFVGVDHENIESTVLKDIVKEFSHEILPVNPIPFHSDRDYLLDLIRKQNMVIMPSLHEGFGLTGWEAISACVPLIVTSKSGLYELLKRELSTEDRMLFHTVKITGKSDLSSEELDPKKINLTDITAIKEAILSISVNMKASKEKAKKLREKLSKFTWDNAATDFFNALLRLAIEQEIASPTSANATLYLDTLSKEPSIGGSIEQQLTQNLKNEILRNSSIASASYSVSSLRKTIRSGSLAPSLETILNPWQAKMVENNEDQFNTNSSPNLVSNIDNLIYYEAITDLPFFISTPKLLNFSQDIIANPRSIVIEGPAFSGKTTLFVNLAKDLMNQSGEFFVVKLNHRENLSITDIPALMQSVNNKIVRENGLHEQVKIIYFIDDLHKPEPYAIASDVTEKGLGFVWGAYKVDTNSAVQKDLSLALVPANEIYGNVCTLLTDEDIDYVFQNHIKSHLTSRPQAEELIFNYLVSNKPFLLKTIADIVRLVHSSETLCDDELKTRLNNIFKFKSDIINYLLPVNVGETYPLALICYLQNPLESIFKYVLSNRNA